MTSPHRCYSTCPVQKCLDCRHPKRPSPTDQRGEQFVAAQIDRLKAIAERIRARKAQEDQEQ